MVNSLGFLLNDFYSAVRLLKLARIIKLPNGKYRVVSEKGKNLGTYNSKLKAKNRLKQVEMFKHMKKASDESLTYSAISRKLKKYDLDLFNKFRQIFKKHFDLAVLENENAPEESALKQTLQDLSEVKEIIKSATALDLGNSEYAGHYLANLVKFLLQRISEKNRPKSLNNMKKKIYYLNEYDLAKKDLPRGSALGQSITLLKHILFGHPPHYIRSVLNSIVRHL